MKPDYQVIWRLSTHEGYQWINRYMTFDTSHDLLMVARCTEFLGRCLRGFGVKQVCYGEWAVNVILSVKDNFYDIKVIENTTLRPKEMDLVLAIEALMHSWAIKNGLTLNKESPAEGEK